MQNGAQHQQSMQLQQQSSRDPTGIPAQALQNMQFGPMDTSPAMLPLLQGQVRTDRCPSLRLEGLGLFAC